VIDKAYLLHKRGILIEQLEQAKIVAAQAQGAIDLCDFLIDQCDAEELAQFGPERADPKPAFSEESEDAPDSSDNDLSRLEDILPDNASISGVVLKDK
jgi:hypothetical protein